MKNNLVTSLFFKVPTVNGAFLTHRKASKFHLGLFDKITKLNLPHAINLLLMKKSKEFIDLS